ncbi:MFS transporter [candidate division KSB1 bacterium]|nr:MFS transporter [candidate division KSB1 bacterium]
MPETTREGINEKLIRFKEKLGYAAGDTASCLYYQTFAMFLMIFYTDTFGITPAAVGTMLLVTRIWDTFNDPLMGMIADRTNSRFGKFRPWLLWMAVPFAVSGILVFTTPNLSYTGKLIYAYITYSLATMVYTAVNIPYGALLGVMTPHSDERTKLSSYRFIGAYIGNLIVQGTLLHLVAFLGKGNSQRGYQLAITLYAVLAAALWIFVFSQCKERVAPLKGEQSKIRRDLADLMQNRPWLVLCLMGILSLIWISIRNASMLYYFKYYVGVEEKAAAFMVVGTVFTIVGVMTTPYITRILGGKKKSFIILNAINIVAMALFYLAGPTDIVYMYACHIVGSFIMGPIFPMIWAMYADTADYGEWRFGRRATGLVFSAATFSQKLGWTVGGSVAAFILAWFGYQANVPQTPETLQGIRMMMSLLPAALAVLVILAALLYNLDAKLQRQIEKELIERKERAAAE